MCEWVWWFLFCCCAILCSASHNWAKNLLNKTSTFTFLRKPFLQTSWCSIMTFKGHLLPLVSLQPCYKMLHSTRGGCVIWFSHYISFFIIENKYFPGSSMTLLLFSSKKTHTNWSSWIYSVPGVCVKAKSKSHKWRSMLYKCISAHGDLQTHCEVVVTRLATLTKPSQCR